MKICYFGIYQRDYSRAQINFQRFKKCSFEVIECHENFRFPDKIINNKKDLICQKLFLLWERIRVNWLLLLKFFKTSLNVNIIFIGHPYDYEIILAYFLAKITRKKLIFDPFISNFETAVDRGSIKLNTYSSKVLWWFDKLVFSLPDCLIIDTFKHAEYLKEEFKFKTKIYRIFVAAQEDIFYPQEIKKNNSNFNVLFFGNFIPLQGVEYIIQAAKILENEDIFFNIIGDGQTYSFILKLSQDLNLKKIKFLGYKSPQEIANFIAKADLGLGIFGKTPKAQLVIPNKVYQIMAMRKAVLTGENKAACELLEAKVDFWPCKMADAESLAKNILFLKNNSMILNKIAENGYLKYKKDFNMEKTADLLCDIINKIYNGKKEKL